MQLSFTLVPSLKKKYQTAVSSRQASLEVLKDLDSCVDPKLCEIWKAQEEKALSLRGDHLKIYNVQFDKGKLFLSPISHICIHCKNSTISSRNTSTT